MNQRFLFIIHILYEYIESSSFLISLVTCICCFYFFKAERKRFSLYWGIGWIFYLVNFSILIFSLKVTKDFIISWDFDMSLSRIFWLSGTYFIMHGVYSLKDKALPGYWTLLLSVSVLFEVSSLFINPEYKYFFSLPFYIMEILICCSLSLAFFRNKKITGITRYMSGHSYIIHGVLLIVTNVVSPFSPSNEIFSTLFIIVLFATALGTMFYFYSHLLQAWCEKEDRFEDSFSYAGIPMSITDTNGRYIKVNSAFCKFIGYSEEELLKMSFEDITHPDDLEYDQSMKKKLYSGEINNYHCEKRYLTKSGDTVWINLSVALIRDINGRSLYCICHMQDITEKKLAQDNDFTLKEALEYERLRTEFFANLSHELRTPLNLIFSSIQLMESYILNGLNREKFSLRISNVLKTSKQSCCRLIRLVNNMIDISRIDAGFYDMNLVNCNIVSIIEDIALSAGDYALAKGLTLIFDTDIEEKIVACDPDMIERVLLNLLANSIKFTSPGGSIYVSVMSMEDSTVLTVEDTGSGIPGNKLSHIFDRFVQVDKSLNRNHEGSGIGLSLVKSMVEMHHGSITAQSEIGKGTIIIIRLPDKSLEAECTNYLKDSNFSPRSSMDKIKLEFSDIYL